VTLFHPFRGDFNWRPINPGRGVADWQAVQVPPEPGSLHLHSFGQLCAARSPLPLVLSQLCLLFILFVLFGVPTTIANMLQFPGLGPMVEGCSSCCLFASPFYLPSSIRHLSPLYFRFLLHFHLIPDRTWQAEHGRGTSKMCCNCLILPFLEPHSLPLLPRRLITVGPEFL